ncbi:MAG: MarR family winged helix-turn-helix transcriptional regulator [Campylobacterota bacterium]
MQLQGRDLKFLLLQKLHIIEELSQQEAKNYGYEDNDILSSSRILALIDNGIITVSAIAKKLGVSRQAIHKSVRKLCDKGFIKFCDQSENRKNKNIIMTKSGHELLACRKDVMATVEKKIESKLGKREYKKLKTLLESDWGFSP